MNRKVILTIAIIVILAGAAYYYRDSLFGDFSRQSGGVDRSTLQKVSATVTYEVPGGEDTERFDLFLNESGAVVDLEATNVETPPDTEAQAHVTEFGNTLLAEIKGKKLSELEKLDKVGTSSLSTAGFNSILDELKAQL